MPSTRRFLMLALVLAMALAACIAFFMRSTPVAESLATRTNDSPKESSHATLDRARSDSKERSVATKAEIPHATSRVTDATHAGGTIHGRVVDPDAHPVTGSVVLVLKGRNVQRRDCDARGVFEFASLGAGTYRVDVDPTSLPKGYLPPYQQEVEVAGPVAGMYATVVRVPETGGTFEVELQICLGATVHGYVFGPDGEHVENAFVDLQNLALDRANVDAAGQADENGHFEIERVYPSRYRPHVYLTAEHRLATLSFPKLANILVPPGATVELDVHMPRGTCTIDGVVVDEEGKTVQGVDVKCYYASAPGEPAPDGVPYDWGDAVSFAVSDAAGKFTLANLPLDRMTVLIGADASANRSDGSAKLLARWAEPRDFDFRTPGERVDTQWIVRRSHPFVLRGKVVIDAAWSERNGVSRRTIRVVVRSSTDKRDDRSFRLDTDGQFEWDCETPHDAVTVIVSDSKRRFSPKESLIFPEPSKTLSFEVTVP